MLKRRKCETTEEALASAEGTVKHDGKRETRLREADIQHSAVIKPHRFFTLAHLKNIFKQGVQSGTDTDNEGYRKLTT